MPLCVDSRGCSFARSPLNACFAIPVTIFAAEKVGEKRKIEVPDGSAERTLKEFSAQSGLDVLFVTASVASARTNAGEARLTPRDAIDLPLSGTSLIAAQDPQNGVARVHRGSGPNGPAFGVRPA